MKLVIKGVGLVILIIVMIVIINIGRRIVNTYRTEKNAGTILKSIVKIEFQGKDIIKLDDNSYLTKTSTDFVRVYMKNKGCKLEDRLGATYVIKNDYVFEGIKIMDQGQKIR